jgi:hypothetical protein
MAEEKQSGGGSNFIVLVAAVVSAGYFIWQKPHLEGFRPIETLRQAHDDRGKQDVEARLWQDPLAAVQEQYEREKGKITSSEEHSIDKARGYFGGSPVIGVMLPGGPYPEDSEARRRYRYAVLAALHTTNYDPIDENHLGYFETTQYKPHDSLVETWDANGDFKLKLEVKLSSDKQEQSLPTVIPFEKFRNRDRKISVLWLNEDVLDANRHPIENVKALLCRLNYSNTDNPKNRGNPIKDLSIIGPYYSQTLINILKSVHDKQNEASDMVLAGTKCSTDIKPNVPIKALQLYNFGATAAEGTVLSYSGFSDNNKLEKILKDQHIDYYRTISTDKDLAPVLVKELKRRGLNLQKTMTNSDHVVLVSESDTFYGRSLRDTIEEELSKTAPRLPIELFSYFRGLDGQLPGMKLSAKTNNDQESGETAKGQQPIDSEKAAGNQDGVAEGQGQFDYLQRLADHIRRLDDKFRHEGPGKIAAVGILGSDVYDKQLLIEALKPELPEAVFFTTDLDALLVPHDKFRSTRNLIVASSYGLELAPSLQGGIPPFRTSYQSSIFLATRLAVLNNLPPATETGPVSREGPDSMSATQVAQKTTDALNCRLPNNSSNPADHVRTTAKLFQIGRSQVQPLPTAQQSLSDNDYIESCNRKKPIDDLSSVDPAEAHLFTQIKSGSVFPTGLLIAIMMVAVALTGSKRLRKSFFRHRNKSAESRDDPIHPDLGWMMAAVPLTTSERLRELRFPYRNTRAESHYAPTRPDLGWRIFLLTEAVLLGLWLSASWPWWASLLTERGLGEPMSLFEGISVWPTVALRAISILLGLYLIFYALHRLKIDLKHRKGEMDVKNACLQDRKGPPPWLVAQWRRWFVDRLYEMAALLFYRPRKTLNLESGTTKTRNSGPTPDQFDRLWDTYSYYGQKHWRVARAFIASLIMMGLWFLLASIFGESYVPARGLVAYHMYKWITRIDVSVTLIMIFIVVDATLLSRWFVLRLSAIESHWPRVERDQEDWSDIKFTAGRTACITQLMYIPFAMLALLVVSGSPIFDNFTVTPTLVIGLAIILTLIIVSVSSLRHAAEEARKKALDNLSKKITANHGRPDSVSRLESLRSDVRDMQEGAFAAPLSQPIVKAVLLPLASYGGTWLVQLYALPGL